MAKAKKPATIGRNMQVMYGIKRKRDGKVYRVFPQRDDARAWRDSHDPKGYSVVRGEFVIKGKA